MIKILLLAVLVLAMLATAVFMYSTELRDRPYLYVLADKYKCGYMSYEVYVSLARAAYILRIVEEIVGGISPFLNEDITGMEQEEVESRIRKILDRETIYPIASRSMTVRELKALTKE